LIAGGVILSKKLMPEPPLSWQGNPKVIEARKLKKQVKVSTDPQLSLLLEADKPTHAGAPE